MKQKTRLSYVSVVVLALLFGLTSAVAVAKNDNAKSDNTSNSAQTQEKRNRVNMKNFEMADEVKGTTNAQLHKEKSQEVVKVLKAEAKKQKTAGNIEVSKQIEQVVAVQEKVHAQDTAAIAQVESRGKVRTFLFGTDYKNLGQLRSGLAQNRNEIRKLTQSLNQVQTLEEKVLIEAQLFTLTQERERIKTLITTNEGDFSLFGWVSRFLNNYEQSPINEQEETQLTTEVENAVEVADVTVPTVPAASTATPEIIPTTSTP